MLDLTKLSKDESQSESRHSALTQGEIVEVNQDVSSFVVKSSDEDEAERPGRIRAKAAARRSPSRASSRTPRARSSSAVRSVRGANGTGADSGRASIDGSSTG